MPSVVHAIWSTSVFHYRHVQVHFLISLRLKFEACDTELRVHATKPLSVTSLRGITFLICKLLHQTLLARIRLAYRESSFSCCLFDNPVELRDSLQEHQKCAFHLSTVPRLYTLFVTNGFFELTLLPAPGFGIDNGIRYWEIHLRSPCN